MLGQVLIMFYPGFRHGLRVFDIGFMEGCICVLHGVFIGVYRFNTGFRRFYRFYT